MNLTELKTELYARGFDYLSEDAAGVVRAERWLNQAYREILNLQAWPFLVVTSTGTAGAGTISVPDLRKIIWVRDVSSSGTYPLQRVAVADLVNQDAAVLTDTGTPESYYVESGGQVKAYPVGGTLEVRYVKRIEPLTGTDTPLFDEEYHNIIVDRAVVKAYIDSDNFEAAAALKAEFDAGVLSMTEDYLMDSREVSFIDVGTPYDG